MHFFRQKAPISATVRKKVFQCKVLTGFYHPQHWPCYSSFSGSPGKWLTIVRSPFTCKLAAGQTSTTKTVIIRLYSHNIHAINSTIKWQICCDEKYYFQRLLSITNENLHNYWLMLIDNILHCWRFKTLLLLSICVHVIGKYHLIAPTEIQYLYLSALLSFPTQSSDTLPDKYILRKAPQEKTMLVLFELLRKYYISRLYSATLP